MMTMAQQTQATPFELGTRYLIRVRKQYGHTRYCANFYLRKVFRNLKRTEVEDASIILINAPRHLLLITTHIHPEDADTIRREFAMFPEVDMFPILKDVQQGDPFNRYIFCVHITPPRKSTRLPKVAQWVNNYRWVVIEKIGGEKQGILISEEPPTVPYPCVLTTEAYLITVSQEQDCMRFTDLRHYNPAFTEPLSASIYPCPAP